MLLYSGMPPGDLRWQLAALRADAGPSCLRGEPGRASESVSPPSGSGLALRRPVRTSARRRHCTCLSSTPPLADPRPGCLQSRQGRPRRQGAADDPRDAANSQGSRGALNTQARQDGYSLVQKKATQTVAVTAAHTCVAHACAPSGDSRPRAQQRAVQGKVLLGLL